MRDLAAEKDLQIATITDLIGKAKPDVLLLLNVDHDLEGKALEQLSRALAAKGTNLPYRFARPPNRGIPSGLDLNGNGKLAEPDDAHGYGEFRGQGGMAILSRYPVDDGAVQDFTNMLWRDLPDHLYPMTNAGPWGGDDIYSEHRLSTTGHWVVPLILPDGRRFNLLAWHASPPVFDGKEDRNGRRNHDETAFWLHYLDGKFGPVMPGPFAVIGAANLDPKRGEGRRAALHKLLAHPMLQDPFPDTPTANWPPPGPGRMRVDYILPSAQVRVRGLGFVTDPAASRHSLLWIDLSLPPP